MSRVHDYAPGDRVVVQRPCAYSNATFPAGTVATVKERQAGRGGRPTMLAVIFDGQALPGAVYLVEAAAVVRAADVPVELRTYAGGLVHRVDLSELQVRAFAPGEAPVLVSAKALQALLAHIDRLEDAVMALDGDFCWSCGCSENNACEGGCGWHDENLCTRCAANGVEAAGHPCERCGALHGVPCAVDCPCRKARDLEHPEGEECEACAGGTGDYEQGDMAAFDAALERRDMLNLDGDDTEAPHEDDDDVVGCQRHGGDGSAADCTCMAAEDADPFDVPDPPGGYDPSTPEGWDNSTGRE